MDNPRSTFANGDDIGIPDDLRCKRSDGKQWRCTAMSMPDKTVCEKHYIQAKKRAANSAMRAHMKKAKRKSLEESDMYLEDKSDDFDTPLSSGRIAEQSHQGKKSSNSQVRYSPDTPPTRSLPGRDSSKHDDDSQRDLSQYEENWKSYKTTAADSSKNLSQKSFDVNAMTEYSDASTNSSEEIGGQSCHQCRKNDRDGVIWCLRCDRRGYCSSCISKWYLDIPLEEIQKICPACRGICNCKVCLRGGILIKVRIREIPALDKLQYLYCLLSSVLPVIKRIHVQQCYEVELEKRMQGDNMRLIRAKLNADEQMCCNFCRIPIIDYHRHCPCCYYDLCLSCCQDLREASTSTNSGDLFDNGNGIVRQDDNEHSNRQRLNFSEKISNWKASCYGNIPCPPSEYGGCGHFQLNLCRIFKMNWVAKLVKNVEEMVGGCRVRDFGTSLEAESDDPSLLQCAHRDYNSDNFLYCPTSSDIKFNGISDFRKHWAMGKPIIVRQVFDSSSIASWDPVVIWRGIRDTNDDERMKDENQLVKAINFSDQSEVNIELVQFIEGYFDGRISENGRPEMLKLKNWPSPSASEEFILYQRPEFIVKLPLLEYIHSKWGLLNVAAKLPHYSLQNDVGPKIFICYGASKEPSAGDSVTSLSINMRDMVYLLVHTHSVKPKDSQKIDIECTENATVKSVANELHGDEELCSGDGRSADLLIHGHGLQDEPEVGGEAETEATLLSQKMESSSADEQTANSIMSDRDIFKKTSSAVVWDVYRRKDVPKLTEYLSLHWKEFGKSVNLNNDLIMQPLYDGALYLDGHHKRKLKDEFGVEPWTFEQRLGEAVFIPSGCPFQVMNLQSNVQLGLDFLSPESVGEAARMAADIRCLPNDHEAKLQVLEVGKISLYAASSVIKEVQKLVLDPKLSDELGVGDPNLTAAVSENLEEMTKRRQISCA